MRTTTRALQWCEEGGVWKGGVLKDQTPAHSTQSKKTHPEILIKDG
jgi:hypothetical protein